MCGDADAVRPYGRRGGVREAVGGEGACLGPWERGHERTFSVSVESYIQLQESYIQYRTIHIQCTEAVHMTTGYT